MPALAPVKVAPDASNTPLDTRSNDVSAHRSASRRFSSSAELNQRNSVSAISRKVAAAVDAYEG
jgi:hypothetical protein